MKKIFLALALSLLLASCSQQPCKEQAPPPAPTVVVVHDTVVIKPNYDSLRHEADSLRRRLFVANFKIEKVKFYLKIVDRKPSQKVFLKGWVARAVR